MGRIRGKEMKIILKDVFGVLISVGDYESFADCMVQNKHNLSYADFGHNNFEGENFIGSDFSNASFKNACFSNASFAGVDFSKTIFSGADFRGTNLNFINFTNANLRGTGITCKQLINAVCTNAKLDYTLLKIDGSRGFFCGYGGMVDIGFKCLPVADWLSCGIDIDDYLESEQEEYLDYVKAYSRIWTNETKWK
jgi:hypothetical protein